MGQVWLLERGYITGFTGFRMARLALDQSPVGFSLKAWMFGTFFLGFTAEKAFTITEGFVAAKPYIGLFKCYRSCIVLSITLCNVLRPRPRVKLFSFKI